MPATNIALKCHRYTICLNFLVFINGGNMPIYVTHELTGIKHVIGSAVQRQP